MESVTAGAAICYGFQSSDGVGFARNTASSSSKGFRGLPSKVRKFNVEIFARWEAEWHCFSQSHHLMLVTGHSNQLTTVARLPRWHTARCCDHHVPPINDIPRNVTLASKQWNSRFPNCLAGKERSRSQNCLVTQSITPPKQQQQQLLT